MGESAEEREREGGREGGRERGREREREREIERARARKREKEQVRERRGGGRHGRKWGGVGGPSRWGGAVPVSDSDLAFDPSRRAATHAFGAAGARHTHARTHAHALTELSCRRACSLLVPQAKIDAGSHAGVSVSRV